MVQQENKFGYFVHYYKTYKDGEYSRIGMRGNKGECENYLNKYYNKVDYESSRPAGTHDKKGRHTDAGLIVSCDIKWTD